ncbi:hypothetical protein VPH13_14410 [Stenotrophomonas pavanii]|uniref:hypothetical protein n=1 Tax=Stenotrophomonas pavanii TaxID=487698 RepID=UPI002DB60588|nr:hypothetical protein [Stenotrophomonas pavanii]MEC4339916.1 hypothetical protein [Stenotrophomonas pavanii]
MAQLTNEQVTAACLAHYPEWASFHQHEREAFRNQMTQTLQAYESAKAAAPPITTEDAIPGPPPGRASMYLLDLGKKTSTPAAIVPLPAADLVRRCAEIIDWQKTGVLKGDALRDFAQKRWPSAHDSLQIAEKETAREAFAYLVSNIASPDEIGAWATSTISAIATENINDKP